jgi:hypothetical protein
MKLTRFVLGACAALACLPASALAQTPADPDSYLSPILLNDGDFTHPKPIPDGSVPGYTVDTTMYGVQSDVFNPPGSGGPPEPTSCGTTDYGKTVWSVFYADRWGRAAIKAVGGFDPVIAIIPFNDPATDATPHISKGLCVDRLIGLSEDFGDSPPAVAPGWYAIQMGGSGNAGGTLQGTLEFLHPARLTPASASLSYQNATSKGAKVSVKATAPKGAKISFKCVKVSCGKLPRSQTIKKPAGPALARPLGTVSLRGAAAGRVLPRAAAKSDPPVFEARSYIKNKFLKRGTRLEVRITAPGYVGTYVSWTVGSGKVSSPNRGCLNPGASKPARRCNG